MFYICLASIEQPQNNWLIKTYSFPIGKFILIMLIGEETIEYQSIIFIKVIQKKKKKIQKIRITTIVGVNVPESQIMYISYK